MIGNITLAELNCSVDNVDITVSELRWKRGEEFLNDTDKYDVTTSNPSTTIAIRNPGKFAYSRAQCALIQQLRLRIDFKIISF